jgi:hypothetical protein
MKNRRNYYRILHVQEDAPEEIIRTSYRTLMQRMRMHPDLGGVIDGNVRGHIAERHGADYRTCHPARQPHQDRM